MLRKNKSVWLVLLAVLLIVFCGVRLYRVQAAQNNYINSNVPTLFFHGWGSSYRAERQIANYAKNKGVTNTIIRADVSAKGEVELIGSMKKNAKNPIVEVNYQDNKNANYNEDAKWMKNVVVALQKKYGIKKFNVVGHSMGNMSIMFYLLNYGGDKNLPQIQKQVDIAGHFNGILGMDDKLGESKLEKNGKPNIFRQSYKKLLAIRESYPKNQIDVLNIYGDIGDKSDGRVSNNSSKSLKYLLNSREKSYQELKISGKYGQHSKLHESKGGDKALIGFLWAK